MPDTTNQAAPITIKKYANRRLYNTATSSYVTLDNLCQMVKDGADFVVYDAKTGEDITRAVLTQIIVEEEGKGQNLLPISFLRQNRRSEEHTSELQSHSDLVCRLLLEKKKKKNRAQLLR